MANLVHRVDKPDNVYRYIQEWEAVPATTGQDIHYLFLYGIFQWRGRGSGRLQSLLQYSATRGHSVDLNNPAHILAQDGELIGTAFDAFRKRCR